LIIGPSITGTAQFGFANNVVSIGSPINQANPNCEGQDGALSEEKRKQVYDFLRKLGWRFGWKSDTMVGESLGLTS